MLCEIEGGHDAVGSIRCGTGTPARPLFEYEAQLTKVANLFSQHHLETALHREPRTRAVATQSCQTDAGILVLDVQQLDLDPVSFECGTNAVENAQNRLYSRPFDRVLPLSRSAWTSRKLKPSQ